MQTFLFPGQGSQIRGMGRALFDTVDEFTSVEKRIDDLLGYSVRRICLEDPDGNLKRTRYTQPALFVVNALHYYRALSEGKRADYAAGHSLGEYNALLAAGAFDFLTGVQLVRKRGELMDQVKNGGMAAIIGINADQVAKVLSDNGLLALDVANFNSPSQTVISGLTVDIQRAESAFKRAGVQMFVVLPVSAAFHSRYMADTATKFASFLNDFEFQALKIPVVANVTGQPYPRDSNARTIKTMLVEQITKPVRWAPSMQFLLGLGASNFSELGPGMVLTRLLSQIRPA